MLQDSLSHAKAFWVTRDIIAWKVSEDITACYLYASKCATLYLADSVEGRKWLLVLCSYKADVPFCQWLHNFIFFHFYMFLQLSAVFILSNLLVS